MELWEVALFILFCIIVGGAGFVGLFRLFLLLDRQRPVASLFASVAPASIGEEVAPVIEQAASAVRVQVELMDPKLVAEVDHNLRIASEPWKGELAIFDTRTWDTLQYEVSHLPTDLQDGLRQVYDAIVLANEIAWFSKEFNRRSPDLDEGYQRVRTNIARRLQMVKQGLVFDGVNPA